MAERLQKELSSVRAASENTSPQYILESLLEETQVMKTKLGSVSLVFLFKHP